MSAARPPAAPVLRRGRPGYLGQNKAEGRDFPIAERDALIFILAINTHVPPCNAHPRGKEAR